MLMLTGRLDPTAFHLRAVDTDTPVDPCVCAGADAVVQSPSGSARSLSPQISAATPPIMIAQNEDDPSAHVENSLMLYYQLKRTTGRAPSSALHLFPTGGHGFGLCQAMTSNKECCEWPLAAQRFLQDGGFAPHWPALPCTGVYNAKGDVQCHA